ncbi:hypothetical protein E4H12_10825 [Candidatus Thorarchaeota archaeon]|nr:MAG: hypothetical protein E4H12_10825 [Candidatus Thorarchaeota archaeon]
MDKKEQLKFNALQVDVRRLQQVVGVLVRRITMLEKQNRSIKARAHQTGLDMATLNRASGERSESRGGPYDPPRGGRF